MSNPYESLYEAIGRLKKVITIVPLLIKAGITSKELIEADEDDWKLVHQALKLDHTSPATRSMVLEKLTEWEKENGVS